MTPECVASLYCERNHWEIQRQYAAVWKPSSRQARFMQIRISTCSYLQKKNNERQRRFSHRCSFFSVLSFWFSDQKTLNVNVLANFQAFWMQSFLLFVWFFFVFMGWLNHTHKVNRAGWRFLSPPSDLDTLFHHDGLVCVAEEPGLCDGSCESGRFYLSVCCLVVVFSSSTGTWPGSGEQLLLSSQSSQRQECLCHRVVAVLQFECFVCEVEFLLENLPRHLFLRD